MAKTVFIFRKDVSESVKNKITKAIHKKLGEDNTLIVFGDCEIHKID